MKPNRRQFLGAAAASSLAYAARSLNIDEQPERRPASIRAIAFDAFVIFNPGVVRQRTEELFPGKGSGLTDLWRTRQFEYTWIRTTGQHYRDFWHVTEDALNYAASSMKLQLSKAQRERLMSVYRELPLWPDSQEVVAELNRQRIRMAFLSNFTSEMLDANLKSAKLRDLFEAHLTTDRVGAFKPSPHAYQMALDHFGLPRQEIAFAAFAPWDAAGAKWFGYPTIWVNRANAPEELLGVKPDVTKTGATGLWDSVQSLSAGT
jgi:2-haloacid dehalogenase